MKKRFLLGTSLLLGSFIAQASFAEGSKNFYLSIGGGVAFPRDVEGDYTAGGVNYNLSNKTDNPEIYSFGIGKYFNDFRVEFNYSKLTTKTDEQTQSGGGIDVTASITPALEYKLNSYLVYGYRDFPNDSKFTPYAGLGLGVTSLSQIEKTLKVLGTNVDATLDIPGTDKSVFTYAFKGGVTYDISEKIDLYSEATYQNIGSFDIPATSSITANYDGINILAVTAGLKFNF